MKKRFSDEQIIGFLREHDASSRWEASFDGTLGQGTARSSNIPGEKVDEETTFWRRDFPST